MDNEKRNEWLEFRAKNPGVVDWKTFYDWAKDPKSAFHDDLEWDQKRAAQEYYRKRCLNLIILYDHRFCNTATADQSVRMSRLHATYDGKLLEKGIKKRVGKTAKLIAEDEHELAFFRAATWSRLRRVVSDLDDFVEYLPEFREIYDFLSPRVRGDSYKGIGEQDNALRLENRQRGAAAN